VLCSNCSQIIKPVVAIDIDGTLGDYHTHFLKFTHQYLAVPEDKKITTYDGTGKMSNWFTRTYGVDIRVFRDVKLAYRTGGQKRSMPVYTGARHMTKVLSDMGAEIWLTTTRPYLRLDSVDPDTRFWLKHHDITFDHLLYDDDKYDVLANRVDSRRVVAVLDDQTEELVVAARNFGRDTCLLAANWYNRVEHRTWPKEQVCLNLDIALDRIYKRVEEWSERTDSQELSA
jgi:uncharacterized HAD superfamily protein